MKTVYINESSISHIRLDEKKRRKNKKKPSAMSQVGGKVNAGIMDAIAVGGVCEGAEPESDTYNVGFENRVNSYAHVNEERGISNFENEKKSINELIDNIITWIPKIISDKYVVKKTKDLNRDVRDFRPDAEKHVIDASNELIFVKSDIDGKMKPLIATLYNGELPGSLTKGKFQGFENLKVVVTVKDLRPVTDENVALKLIGDQRGSWSKTEMARSIGDTWSVKWNNDEFETVIKSKVKTVATAGARAGKFTGTGKDGKEFNWWTKLKDGKVSWLELQINNVIATNGVPFNTESLPGLIYHEITHEYDNYYEMKRTNGASSSLGFKQNDSARMLNSYAQELMSKGQSDFKSFSVGCLLYVLYVKGELDAHAVQVYGDLQNMNSTRNNANEDIKSTYAYKEYQLAIDSLNRLRDYSDFGWSKEDIEKIISDAPIVGKDYTWYDENGRLNGNDMDTLHDRVRDYEDKYNDESDVTPKWLNKTDNEIENVYSNMHRKKSLMPKTNVLDVFIKRSEELLEKLYKKMTKVASLYYDEREKSESNKKEINESKKNSDFEYKKYMKQIAEFMAKNGLNVKPFPKIKLDDSEQDGLFIRTGYYAPQEKLVVLFTKDRHPKDVLRSFAHEMIHHHQNLSGKNLSFSGEDNVKDNSELEELESEAYLKGNIYFRKWTEYENNKHKKAINESLIMEIDAEDIDMSSFKLKKELNPKFWVDGHLDKRIRLRLLDLADDFFNSLDIDWIEPSDIIMTGSLANYNWDKKYSDIDLHILLDFNDVDDNVEFVRSYFDAKKTLWNEKHDGIKIFGFPVEVYVQDINQKHNSSGIYSLDKDKWIDEPERETMAKHKIDYKEVKKRASKYATEVDKLYDRFKASDGDCHKIELIYNDASDLFKEIKDERDKGFSKDSSEMNTGNITFKTLRRMNYIGKLVDLKEKTYDIINSLK